LNEETVGHNIRYAYQNNGIGQIIAGRFVHAETGLFKIPSSLLNFRKANKAMAVKTKIAVTSTYLHMKTCGCDRRILFLL
jgi:hypothetical protein